MLTGKPRFLARRRRLRSRPARLISLPQVHRFLKRSIYRSVKIWPGFSSLCPISRAFAGFPRAAARCSQTECARGDKPASTQALSHYFSIACGNLASVLTHSSNANLREKYNFCTSVCDGRVSYFCRHALHATGVQHFEYLFALWPFKEKNYSKAK